MSLITKNQCGLIIKSIHLLIVALLGGCTLVPKQDGLNNAESRSTKGFQTRRTETPYPLDPEPLKGQAPEAASSAVGADAAMTAALAGAAMGIGAVLKSPESRKDIQGTCF